jgi:hypothetical protein
MPNAPRTWANFWGSGVGSIYRPGLLQSELQTSGVTLPDGFTCPAP